MHTIAWLILGLPLLSATCIHLGFKRNQGLSTIIATSSALITLILSLVLLGNGKDTSTAFTWVGAMGEHFKGIEIGLRIDQLSRGMLIVVTGVGFLVHLFSLTYMKDDRAKARYFCGLSLFMFSMTGIVLASNFIMMFIFWELVGLSSYLLIGHWYQKSSAADASKKAFLTNRIGDFGFMIGILMLWGITGTVTFSELELWSTNPAPFNATYLGIALLCIFAGAVGKSAQAPLHVWLPDAMEGPTPVSALIHAATMVAAGVYMLARFFTSVDLEIIAFAPQTIAWIGGITSLLAALMATQQDDIKKILAYSTLSQLGYMVMAVGLLNAQAGVFHLFTHAWFKALLFLGSGAVIYACHHEQNIWKMGGLRKRMPLTFLTFTIGTLALMGFPLTAGFFSKEQILEAALHQSTPLFVIAAIVATLTTFYMGRLLLVAFLGENRSENSHHAKEVGALMLIPLVTLSVLAIISGYPFVASALSPLYEQVGFHFGPAFWASLTALIVGGGLALTFYRNAETDPLRNKKIALVFRNKFYIDELYAQIVRFGQDCVAAIVHFIDELLIGGLIVGGCSRAAEGIGKLFGRLQSGNLHGYATLFGLGVILLIYITVFVP